MAVLIPAPGAEFLNVAQGLTVNITAIESFEDRGSYFLVRMLSGFETRIDNPTFVTNLRAALVTAGTDDPLTVGTVPQTLVQRILAYFQR